MFTFAYTLNEWCDVRKLRLLLIFFGRRSLSIARQEIRRVGSLSLELCDDPPLTTLTMFDVPCSLHVRLRLLHVLTNAHDLCTDRWFGHVQNK